MLLKNYHKIKLILDDLWCPTYSFGDMPYFKLFQKTQLTILFSHYCNKLKDYNFVIEVKFKDYKECFDKIQLICKNLYNDLKNQI